MEMTLFAFQSYDFVPHEYADMVHTLPVAIITPLVNAEFHKSG